MSQRDDSRTPVGERKPTTTHLVVGHSGSPACARVLEVAADLARRLAADVHVVHSVTLTDYGIDPDVDDFETVRARAVAAERDAIASALDGAGVPWTYHEEHGDPAGRLSRLADDLGAAFILVGATHHRLLHPEGSVSKRLVRMQHRPVMVVPEPPPARPV